MLQIYNTATKKLEEFTPINENEVKFYHCGPTVYSIQHIGNLRGMTMGDLIRRTLSYQGYDVRYVSNYTDVGHLTSDGDVGEDKMAKGASREGLSPLEIANKYIQIFEDDIAALNILPPTFRPRATEFVKQMIEMVQVLIDKGFAYTTPRAIYFDTSKFPDYTKLSGQKLEDQDAGSGVGEVEDLQNKKHPADFAVWFFRTGTHKNALQWWPSPFQSSEVEDGAGFPGWHIECSAMSKDLLGNTIDLHMGGVEHIPVHHTNEIAQSEAANGEKFVNYWLHNEHLTVNDHKMSKSDGTGFTIEDIREKEFEPIVLRYFFLQSHYRSKQNFTWEALQSSRVALDRLVKQLVDMEGSVGEIDSPYQAEFETAISNDFNIPAGLAVVWKLLKDENVATANKLATIIDFDKVLGLDIERLIRVTPTRIEILPEVQDILDERQIAREHKDWQKSDELRDRLEREFGLKVLDESAGQRVEKI
jgi:cysteinyl-tRNA synthetase